LTFGVRALARARGWVAKPRTDRWHRSPTALFGGIAIFAAFLASYLVLRPSTLAGDALIVLCATGMFLLGLVDDFIVLKPYTKLVGQIVISTALTTGGMRLHFLQTEVLDQGLSIFWLVAITNALNLLDNLDGLAGGVAVIAAGFLAYFCHAAGQPQAAQIALALAGAALGFLFFNFNPASIFMGDCGSLFLGFVLGSMGLVTTAAGIRRNVVAVLAGPVFVLLIPIVDTAFVTLVRSLHGRPVSQGGRDHTSHRLVALGYSERSVALMLWAASIAAGLMALLLQRVALPMTVFLIICACVLVAFLGLFVGRVKVYASVEKDGTNSKNAFIPTLADFAYKRRVFEVLCDLSVVVIAYYGAYLLRFGGDFVEPHYSAFRNSLPVVIVVQVVVLLSLGLYKGLWRQTSLEDMYPIVKKIAGAWVATVLALTLMFRLEAISRASLVIDALLLMLGIGGSRIVIRWMSGRVGTRDPMIKETKLLIYGANDMGEIMLRLIRNDRSLGLVAVGFIDDDASMQGRVIHGLPVVGSSECLKSEALRKGANEVAVASDALPPESVERLRELARSHGLGMRCLSFTVQPTSALKSMAQGGQA
jgi:UDP-GlcNAc:undecaprenyl-phosphate/decaprenyl-phosphate GlcNAc-1-phosphate transferase